MGEALRRRRFQLGLALCALLIVAAAMIAHISRAGEVLPGPVRAKVLAVIDGDTIAVQARIWLGQDVEINVRLAGIDAPELHARCAAEREAAARARDALARLIGLGGARDAEVVLNDIRYDKYGGRVLARVATPDGADLGAALLAQRLAHRYEGGKRVGWCGA